MREDIQQAIEAALAWQAVPVRAHRLSDQFVTHEVYSRTPVAGDVVVYREADGRSESGVVERTKLIPRGHADPEHPDRELPYQAAVYLLR